MLTEDELMNVVVDFIDATFMGLAAEARGEADSPAFAAGVWKAHELLRHHDEKELRQIIARFAILYLGALAREEGATDMDELETIYKRMDVATT